MLPKSTPAHNRKNLGGQVFGALTVLSYQATKKKTSHWLCRCECGRESIVCGTRLRSGKTKSCGCLLRKGPKEDLKDRVFGRLTVIVLSERPVGAKEHGHYWMCRCSCGETKPVNHHRLIHNSVRSCGCALREGRGPGKAAENAVLLAYRKSAASREIPYLLDDNEFRRLVRRDCHYCGCGPTNVKSAKSFNGQFHYNGIDRIDNSKGYEATNVVPCCRDCNIAKRTMGYKEFLAWVERVYRHIVAPEKSKPKAAGALRLF